MQIAYNIYAEDKMYSLHDSTWLALKFAYNYRMAWKLCHKAQRHAGQPQRSNSTSGPD